MTHPTYLFSEENGNGDAVSVLNIDAQNHYPNDTGSTGRYGNVRAFQDQDGTEKYVVKKFLDIELGEIESEAQIARTVYGEQNVHLIWNKTKTNAALVLPNFSGISFDNFLSGVENISELFHGFHQLCIAVEKLHDDHEIVHRDLHGGNIIIDPENLKVKLVDFGMASSINERPKKFAKNPNGEAGGEHIAPELFKQAISAKTSQDIYSIAYLLKNKLTEIGNDLEKEYPFLGEIITQALSSNPLDRPAISQLTEVFYLETCISFILNSESPQKEAAMLEKIGTLIDHCNSEDLVPRTKLYPLLSMLNQNNSLTKAALNNLYGTYADKKSPGNTLLNTLIDYLTEEETKRTSRNIFNLFGFSEDQRTHAFLLLVKADRETYRLIEDLMRFCTDPQQNMFKRGIIQNLLTGWLRGDSSIQLNPDEYNKATRVGTRVSVFRRKPSHFKALIKRARDTGLTLAGPQQARQSFVM